MKKQLTIGFIILLCTLSGCTKGNKNIEDISTTNITEDHIVREVVDADGNTVANIDADVIYPETNQIPVVTLKPYEFTNNDIKNMAKVFYGDSEYHRLRNYNEWSAEELNASIQEYELAIEEMEQIYNDSTALENFYPAYLSFFSQQIATLNECLKTAPTEEVDDTPILEFYDSTRDYYTFSHNKETGREEITDTDTVTYTECKLEGTHNNKSCTIKFNDTSHLNIAMNVQDELVWKTYTYKETGAFFFLYDNFNSFDTSLENQCVYSVDEATDMCNSMIKDMGISDMEVMDILHVPVKTYAVSSTGYQYGDPIEEGICGYRLYYGKSINNVKTNISINAGIVYETAIKSLDNSAIQNLPSSEELIFTVMDSGIISIEYNSPTIIENISSDDTTLLDFDTIIGLSEIYLPNIYADVSSYGHGYFNITRIQLGLMELPSSSDSSTITLIPVWDFYEKDSYKSVLTINAIDGNRIDRVTHAVAQ